MSKCRILSTKKLPQSFYSAVPAGVELIEKEFITIHPSSSESIREKVSKLDLNKNLTVVFTSRHAVAGAGILQNQISEAGIYCLSGSTLEGVQKMFPGSNVIGTADNAHKLAEKIIADSVTGVVFFCGNKRRDELPAHLEKNGIRVHEIVVYETQLNPSKIREPFNAILFFSPSAVDSFFMENKLEPDVTCIAIGDTTAASVKEHTNNNIITCGQPSKNCMVSAIEDFISKKKLNDIEK